MAFPSFGFGGPRQGLSFGFTSVASNTTDYVIGNGVPGVNQNTAGLAPCAGTFRNLYVRTLSSPGTSQTFTFTLYIGSPVAMSATALTCQIGGASATTASDLTHAVTIAAGQAWAIQVATSASAVATGVGMVGIEFDPN